LPNTRWITQFKLDNGLTWEEREDGKGRFSGVINPFNQAFYVQYDPAGRPVHQQNYNGTTSDTTWAPRGWLGSVTHRRANGAVIGQFTYTYDNTVGRLLSERDQLGQLHRFSYDNLGQLTDEQHPDLGARGVQYRYDKNGNRASVSRGSVTEYYGVDAAD